MASIYDKQILTEKDLERIEKLGELWNQTNDVSARAEYHEAAETIRKGYGYSGGGDGHQYDPIEESVVSSAIAAKDYTSAIREAEAVKAEEFAQMAQKAQADGDERLRQAYIKNMQQSLGIAQALKADGITGGMTESTRAALANNYLGLRDDIMSDVSDTKTDISRQAADSLAQSDKEIAKAEQEAANDRSEKMTAAEQRDYDRALDEYYKKYQEAKDAYDREWEQKLFDYQKELDTYDREYQKQLDTYDREYQKQQDALDRQAASAKSSSSSGSASKAQEEKLKELKENAWKLLEKGVYDDSFPELLGYSEEALLLYSDNVMAGY